MHLTVLSELCVLMLLTEIRVRHYFLRCVLVLAPLIGRTQPPPIQFSPDLRQPSVQVGSRTLLHPWAGGMACPQFHSLDMNGDGIEERVVFDRVDQSLMVYERSGSQAPYVWLPAPAYLPQFPQWDSWMELADYNGDGHKDLFVSTNGGIALYRNRGPGSSPRFELRSPSLTAFWDFGFRSAIYVLSIDRPGIADLDADGDVDILAFDNFEIGKVNYFRNLSRERYGHSDSLDFVQVSRCWGRFAENQLSSQVVLGLDTFCLSPLPQPLVLRPTHAGSSLNLINPNRDSLPDLLLGDVEGTFLTFLRNGGTRALARMTGQSTAPAFMDTPVVLTKFPAAYLLPSDGSVQGQDPLMDLVVAPNEFYGSNLRQHLHYYRNARPLSAGVPDSLIRTTKTFMVDEMVHHFLKASPAVGDLNGDSLPDLLVAYENSALKPGLALYLNRGQAGQPLWVLEDSLYLRLDTLPVRNPKIATGDLDGDGRLDLLLGHSDSTLMHFRNTGNIGSGGAALPQFQRLSYDYQGLRAGIEQAPELGDLNGDGRPELLVGMRNGRVACFVDQGSTGQPSWFKISDTLGGINVSESISGWSTPRVGDFNRDGLPDLLVGSESGRVFAYPSLWWNLNQPLRRMDLFRYQSSGGTGDSMPHGNWVSPAVGHLDGDSFPDLLLGMFKGGITHWRNRSMSVGLPEHTGNSKQALLSLVLLAHPNPVRSGSPLNLVVHDGPAADKVTLYVRDMYGRIQVPIFSGYPESSEPGRTSFSLSTEGWAPGIYTLVLQKQNGLRGEARLVVLK